MTRRRRFVITGGLGYLGRAVAERAVAAGAEVVVLSRSSRGSPPGASHVAWRLGDRLPEEALAPDLPGVDHVLLHFAHEWRDARDEENVNLVGARRLLDDARSATFGRMVFASSQSARREALNAYGRTKWRIEQFFDAPNEVSLRIGLAYGGPRLGQYGLLCRLAEKTCLLPMVEPRRLVQPIHRDEIAEGALLAVDSNLSGAVALAGAPLPFGDFLDLLRQSLTGGRMRLVPAPLKAMLLLSDVANSLPFGPLVDRERILGLAGTVPIAASDDLTRLGLNVRPPPHRLAEEAFGRRATLDEGRALLRYVMRGGAPHALIRRYATAVAQSRRPGAMRLSFLHKRFPWSLRFVEPFRANSLLSERLNLALLLAADDVRKVRAPDPKSRGLRLADLLFDLIVEALALPTRLVAGAFRR